MINVDYQELINVILWQKARNYILYQKLYICLCNLLIINNRLYALSLNSHRLKLSCHNPIGAEQHEDTSPENKV